MSMLILLRNARRCLLVAGVWSAIAFAPSVNSFAATTQGLKAASPEETRVARKSLAKALVNQPDLLEEPIASVTFEKPVYWSQPSGVLLFATYVKYRGVSNRYCRLVTASKASNEAQLVPVPAQVNIDDCRGYSKVIYVDINGDGILDVIEGVWSKSNRYPVQVVTSIVYLSTDSHPSGYCYSDVASRQLHPADLIDAESAMKALAAAMRRRSLVAYACTPAEEAI